MPAINQSIWSVVFCSIPLRTRIFEPESSQLNVRHRLPHAVTTTGTNGAISRTRQSIKQLPLIIRQNIVFNQNFMFYLQNIWQIIGRISQIWLKDQWPKDNKIRPSWTFEPLNPWTFSKKKGLRSMIGALKINPATCYSPIDKFYSTIAAEDLHFRVRYGNGCGPSAIITRQNHVNLP